MHELSITRNVVTLVAERAAGRRVSQVRLKVGALAGVATDALSFCFDVCAQGTAVEGARLVIDAVPGQGQCRACGKIVAIEHLVGRCDCDAHAPLHVVAGEELLIADIEVEEA